MTPGAPESTPRIPFLSLVPGDDRNDIRAAIDRVVASGWFVLGPEVEAFESEFARAMGAAHAVGVGTGTDAIALILRALDIGPGDEVITTPLSAAYTALAIIMTGARPVFADVDPVRLTLDRGPGRTGDWTSDAGDPAGALVRPGRRHGGDRAGRRAAHAPDCRRLLPGPSRDGRRPARRHDRRGRRIQLLSNQESWSARRRRRGRHERPRAGGTNQASAERRSERPVSASGRRGSELAARRNPGRCPPRPPSAPRRVDRTAARTGRAVSPPLAGHAGRRRRGRTGPRPRLSPVRRKGAGQ